MFQSIYLVYLLRKENIILSVVRKEDSYLETTRKVLESMDDLKYVLNNEEAREGYLIIVVIVLY